MRRISWFGSMRRITPGSSPWRREGTWRGSLRGSAEAWRRWVCLHVDPLRCRVWLRLTKRRMNIFHCDLWSVSRWRTQKRSRPNNHQGLNQPMGRSSIQSKGIRPSPLIGTNRTFYKLSVSMELGCDSGCPPPNCFHLYFLQLDRLIVDLIT